DVPWAPLVLAARPEQRDGRRAHRRREMHWHRIDADEQARARGERAELLDRERAGEADRLRLRQGNDLLDHIQLGGVAGGGEHDLAAFRGEAVDQLGVLLYRPAFEGPSGGWM